MNRYKSILAGIVIVIIVCGLTFYIQSPKQQARSMLVKAVGEDYFNSFMELKGVALTNLRGLKRTTCVVYDYHLQVGNYSTTCEVIFIFDWINRFSRSIGVPPSDNLMSFNVSREEAINIALEQIKQPSLEVEAEIRFGHQRHNPVKRYVWHVSFYLTEKSALSGSLIEVLIDLHSGEVIDVAEIRWSTDID